MIKKEKCEWGERRGVIVTAGGIDQTKAASCRKSVVLSVVSFCSWSILSENNDLKNIWTMTSEMFGPGGIFHIGHILTCLFFFFQKTQMLPSVVSVVDDLSNKYQGILKILVQPRYRGDSKHSWHRTAWTAGGWEEYLGGEKCGNISKAFLKVRREEIFLVFCNH